VDTAIAARQVSESSGSPAGAQHRGPGALQQVPQLLAGGAGEQELVVAAGAQMPQPAPVPLELVRHVAAQFGDLLGDDRGVFEVRAVPGEVLVLPATVHQHRVDAHQLDPAGAGPVQQRLPAMPGRLAPEHDPGEAGLGRERERPVQHIIDHPCVTEEHPPGQDHRVVIGQHRGLLGRSQIDGQDPQITAHDRPQPRQFLVPASITTGERSAVGHDNLLGSGSIRTQRPKQRETRAVDLTSTATGTYYRGFASDRRARGRVVR
jgi:hypothetical protein